MYSKPVYVVTSIKQSLALKGHFFSCPVIDKTNNSKDLANPTHLVYLGVTMIEVNLFYKVEL
jgi:hypothetical protein